jgi:hypothetical protein
MICSGLETLAAGDVVDAGHNVVIGGYYQAPSANP